MGGCGGPLRLPEEASVLLLKPLPQESAWPLQVLEEVPVPLDDWPGFRCTKPLVAPGV